MARKGKSADLAFLTIMAYDRYIAICGSTQHAGSYTTGDLAVWLVDSSVLSVRQVSPSQNVTGSANSSSGADDGKAELDYPFGELIISCGFFLVFLIESLVVHCCPSATHSHGAAASDKDPKDSALSPSSFRALVLFVSLSFHSVFEGLAVGVQRDKTEVLQLCGAVLVHKAIVVFSLALKLVQSGTRARWRLVYLVLFALMSPAGIAVGIGVSFSGGDASSLARAVLEGVAAGTFLYVTFIEILPHELHSSEAPLAKFFFIGIGFTFMAVIAIWA
ncbi:zinc transporter ZIP2-like [Alligator sinensis]|uniref:Zinc transporter ZIP2-like n=1 Tax=Alligator sinensis TaxID=38654 RepID=A0A3Q0FZD4_ALLSI|nr:zinc transporter ZIP2-like [Alligator sinensis]